MRFVEFKDYLSHVLVISFKFILKPCSIDYETFAEKRKKVKYEPIVRKGEGQGATTKFE